MNTFLCLMVSFWKLKDPQCLTSTCTSATFLTPLSPSHQTQTFGVFVVLHTQLFLLFWWCQPLSPTCYTSVQVFYHFMPCCSSHSETSTFERAWLCKQSLTSAFFFYHGACTIIKVMTNSDLRPQPVVMLSNILLPRTPLCAYSCLASHHMSWL